jgi:hypothetical protein
VRNSDSSGTSHEVPKVPFSDFGVRVNGLRKGGSGVRRKLSGDQVACLPLSVQAQPSGGAADNEDISERSAFNLVTGRTMMAGLGDAPALLT